MTKCGGVLRPGHSCLARDSSRQSLCWSFTWRWPKLSQSSLQSEALPAQSSFLLPLPSQVLDLHHSLWALPPTSGPSPLLISQVIFELIICTLTLSWLLLPRGLALIFFYVLAMLSQILSIKLFLASENMFSFT